MIKMLRNNSDNGEDEDLKSVIPIIYNGLFGINKLLKYIRHFMET